MPSIRLILYLVLLSMVRVFLQQLNCLCYSFVYMCVWTLTNSLLILIELKSFVRRFLIVIEYLVHEFRSFFSKLTNYNVQWFKNT